MRWIALTATLIALNPLPALGQPDLSGRDPHWIKDEMSGCWAANPDPAPQESITWTGRCMDGLVSGPGTLSWYASGILIGRDEGNFVRGELSGHGKISFGDGSDFEGEFPGRGVLTLANGDHVDAVSVKESAGWSIEAVR
jgi:MORN repeat protein